MPSKSVPSLYQLVYADLLTKVKSSWLTPEIYVHYLARTYVRVHLKNEVGAVFTPMRMALYLNLRSSVIDVGGM